MDGGARRDGTDSRRVAGAGPAAEQPSCRIRVPGRRSAGHDGAGGGWRPLPRGRLRSGVFRARPARRHRRLRQAAFAARDPGLPREGAGTPEGDDDAGGAPAADGDARPHRRLRAAQRQPRAVRNRDARDHHRRRCGAWPLAAPPRHADRTVESRRLQRRPDPGSHGAGTGRSDRSARRRTRGGAIAGRAAAPPRKPPRRRPLRRRLSA